MSNEAGPKKVDFDVYAEDYEKLLQDQLSFFSGDRSYFSAYKAEILADLVPMRTADILDFGAGIGLMIPHLQAAYPDATIHASDISAASLAHIEQKFPDVAVVADQDLDLRKFDLILVATVLHHISPELRDGVMSRLRTLLKPAGRICIFEHNPFNPVTRRMVSTCPFDEDAILLTMRESIALLSGPAALKIEHRGYSLFFPQSLKALSPLEKLITWLPMGGQYYVVGRA